MKKENLLAAAAIYTAAAEGKTIEFCNTTNNWEVVKDLTNYNVVAAPLRFRVGVTKNTYEIVIFGAPGSGRTTLVKKLERLLAPHVTCANYSSHTLNIALTEDELRKNL